jgi:chromosome segregation ATPase
METKNHDERVWVPMADARQLERELAAVTAERDKWKLEVEKANADYMQKSCEVAKLLNERDELKAECNRVGVMHGVYLIQRDAAYRARDAAEQQIEDWIVSDKRSKELDELQQQLAAVTAERDAAYRARDAALEAANAALATNDVDIAAERDAAIAERDALKKAAEAVSPGRKLRIMPVSTLGLCTEHITCLPGGNILIGATKDELRIIGLYKRKLARWSALTRRYSPQ